MRRVSSAMLPALAVLLTASGARAYTLRESQSGKPARWRQEKVEVVVDATVTGIHPSATKAVAAALAAWDGEAGTSPPTLVVREGPADALGYTQGAANQSTVRYAPDGAAVAAGALAVTVVTFDTQGRILDADIVVNGGPERPWSIVDQPAVAGLSFGSDQGAYDLQNVLTHEAGHLLGFGEESGDVDATMFVSSERGETKKRGLDASDLAGLHELYDGDASDADGSASCAVRAAPAPRGSGWIGIALVAGAAGLALGAASRRRGGARRGLFTGVTVAAFAAGLAPVGMPSGATGHARASTPLAQLYERADVVATVVSSTARWEAGLVVSRLVMRPTSCRVADCPTGDVAVEVFGGTKDGLTQIVGHGIVPRAGAKVPLVMRAGRLAVPRGALAPRGAVETAPIDAPDDERRGGGPAVTTAPAKVDPRRLHDRAAVDLAAVIDRGGEIAEGVVENLSQGGLFVATDDVALPGELVAVEFALPGEPASIRAKAEVRWTRGDAPDGTSGGMGLRFVELDADEASAIGRYVAGRTN